MSFTIDQLVTTTDHITSVVVKSYGFGDFRFGPCEPITHRNNQGDSYREILVGQVPCSCHVIQLVPAQLNRLHLSLVQPKYFITEARPKYFITEARPIRNTLLIPEGCCELGPLGVNLQ
jgi:hypothetical protein